MVVVVVAAEAVGWGSSSKHDSRTGSSCSSISIDLSHLFKFFCYFYFETCCQLFCIRSRILTPALSVMSLVLQNKDSKGR